MNNYPYNNGNPYGSQGYGGNPYHPQGNNADPYGQQGYGGNAYNPQGNNADPYGQQGYGGNAYNPPNAGDVPYSFNQTMYQGQIPYSPNYQQQMPPAPKKKKTGIIIGGIVLLAVIIGVAVMFASGGFFGSGSSSVTGGSVSSYSEQAGSDSPSSETTEAVEKEGTTAAAALTELEQLLLKNDYNDITQLTDTYGESVRVLHFEKNHTATCTIYDEMEETELTSTYSVDGDKVLVRFDDDDGFYEYTITQLSKSAMLKYEMRCRYSYDDSGEIFEYPGFLLEESAVTNASDAAIYYTLDDTHWISKYIGGEYDRDGEANIDLYNEDGSFSGYMTVTHHTSDLYGYAISDTIAFFEEDGGGLCGTFMMECYNGRTYAYFFDGDSGDYYQEELQEAVFD